MKDNSYVPAPKREENSAADKRREDYAQSRDMQAMENNEAIAKRLLLKDKNKVTCAKCGKEFTHGIDSQEAFICPECGKLELPI
jgi:predicted RNA-binding Zn-ribbon protein involved in translation (DUF1610 family)